MHLIVLFNYFWSFLFTSMTYDYLGNIVFTVFTAALMYVLCHNCVVML